MAHLNVYVPDELEEKVKDKAQKLGKSVSAYLTELVRKDVGSQADWQAFLDATWGKWEGESPEIKDLPLDPNDIANFDSDDEKGST